MLAWDKSEFIECLEVTPEEVESEYHGPFSVFRVHRSGIQLELTIFPFEEDVRIRLVREGEAEPIFEYQIMSCQSAVFERSADGAGSLCFTNQASMRILLSVEPDFRLRICEDAR